MTAIRTVLVATDFGSASASALEVAGEIAQRYAAKLVLLHVMENDRVPAGCALPPEVRRAAAFSVSDIAKRMTKRLSAVEGIVREGLAWQEIVQAAKDVSADLVVVGTHDASHGERFLIGSVAEKVVRVCPVPVLTVRAWRFADLAQAGRELAEALLRCEERPSCVVAISRAAAVVGAEVAEAFGIPLRVLFARAVERDGYVVGAICEDGSIYRNAHAASEELTNLGETQRVQRELLDESHRFGDPRVPIGVRGTALLVSDAVVVADPSLVVLQALRKQGYQRVVAAAPIGTRESREALSKVADAVVLVHTLEESVPLARLVRDPRLPSDDAIASRIAVADEWAYAVKKSV